MIQVCSDKTIRLRHAKLFGEAFWKAKSGPAEEWDEGDVAEAWEGQWGCSGRSVEKGSQLQKWLPR